MIITRLSGGLGNQMFQYAWGRALSLRNNDTLALDISSYGHQHHVETQREFRLNHFNIVEKIASPEEIKKLQHPLGVVSKGQQIFNKKILRRFNIGFNQKIFSHKGDI